MVESNVLERATMAGTNSERRVALSWPGTGVKSCEARSEKDVQGQRRPYLVPVSLDVILEKNAGR
jgi:hypothetical protein